MDADTGAGRYNLGLVLSQAGERAPRVRGKLPGRNARKRFTVAVR